MSKLKEQIDKNRASRTETTSSGGKSLLKQQIDAQRSGTTYHPNQSEVGRRVLNGQKTAASDTRKELFVTGSRNIKHQRAEYQKRAAKKRSPSPVLPASASQNTAQQRSGKSRGAYDSSLRDRLTQQRTREPDTRTNQEQYDWVGQRAVRKKADRKDSGMDGWKLLEGMAVQGATGFAESAASTLDLIERQLLNAQEVFMPTGGERVAQGGPFRALHEGIKKEQEDARAVYQPNVEKGGTAAKVADFLGTTTFEAIPQGAVATISAGAKATQAGVNVLNRAAELTPGLWRSIRTAAKGAMENPAFWSSFLQTVGSDYDESIANGASEGQALTMAVANGLLNAGIEVGGGLETMDATKTFGVKDLVKSAVEEGNEEVAQGITQRGLQNLIYQNGNPMFSTTDENAVLNPWTAAQEWGGGAFAGGVLSGASAGTNALMRARYNQQLAELGAVYQGDPEALVEEGLSFAPETRAHQTAAQMQEKASTGRALTDADLGAMVAANEQTMEQQRRLERANTPPQENTQSTDTARAQADYAEALRAAREAEQERAMNRKRVRRAADSFGENGAKALRAAYDGNIRSDEYYAGFAAFYQAGINGADMATVDSDYSDSLTQAQRFAAYSAGQNDAALSLKREQQSAKYAPVAGTDSGLVYDDFVREAVESGRTMKDEHERDILDDDGNKSVYLTAETAARVNSVAKALGVRVQFVDSVRGGTANAQISGSTVQIEKNNENPVMFLIGHEMTHRMQELAPTEYRRFRDIVAQEEADRIQARMDSYAAEGVDLTYEQAMDEVAADRAGRMINDEAALDDFIEKHRDDRTLLQKVRDAIRALVSKLTGAEKKKAQTAQGKLAEAMEAASKQAKALQGQGGDGIIGATRYSTKGKYWRPDLTQNEWALLNRHMEQEIGDSAHALDESTQWAYAEEKGDRVFAIYGIGDGTEATPLYASGGKTAMADYHAFMDAGKRFNYGTDRSTESLNRLFKTLRRKQGQSNGSISATERGKSANGHDRVSAVQGEGNGRGSAGHGTENRRVNAKYSLKTDTQGRELTEQQREYFRDSKVVDRDGQLKVMYQGGTGDFTVFDRKKSSYANLYGRGFYFTDSEAHARQYGSAREFYLNITHPVSTTEATITRSQMREFLQAVADNEDDFSFENYGYGATVDSVLKSVYGKSDFAMLYDVNQTAIGDMVAAVELFNEVNGTDYDGLILDTETVAFRSDQIKNTDNQKPTKDPDIRYSLKAGTESKSAAALQEENRLLREQVKDYIALQKRNGQLQESRDYWKGQTRRTQRVTTDKKAVTAAAKQLIQNYSAYIPVDDIRGDLQSLYDYLASGYDGKDELTYTEARRRAEDIARTLVENAVTVDSDMYDAYSDLRDYLRTTKIIYGKEYHGDIADYGDFRKQQFGRLNLGSEGHTNIDQVYQELSSRWPEFFSEQEQTNPTDQLLHIVEVLDGISEINEYNHFSRYMDQAVTGAANEIMETFFDLPQTQKTFADRQALKLENAKAKGREQVQKVREQYTTRLADQKARSEERLDRAILGEQMAGGRELAKQKRLDAERMQQVREQNATRLAELRAQNRQRVQNAIAKERETRARQMSALKDRYAAKDAAGRERRAARELRAKIIRHAGALSRKLLRPTDQQHIPEALRGAVAAMLRSINLESQYSIDPETGKRAKNADGDPTKRTEAFRALREQYEAIAKGRTDFNGVLDPDLLENLGEVITMKDTRLADMNTHQLSVVWQTVRAIEQSISTANKLLGKSRFAGVLELAENIRQSSATKRTKGNYGGKGLGAVTGWGDRLLNLDMMNPLTFLHLFGDGGDALYRELQAARDDRTRILSETVNLAQEAIGKADIEKLRRKTHTFQVEGGTLTMTTPQLMALYELSKREQAQDHIYKGGIRSTATERGMGRNKTAGENLAAALGKLEAPASGVKVTQGDMATMLSALTEEEVKIADGLQAIMQGYLAQEGNRESMKVYGYQKFTEKDYFPISSDPHQVMDKIGDVLEGGEKRPRSIAEWGSAKGTVDKANNGILLGDIFDVFAQHAVDMATYASHLGAMEDMNRVRSFTFRDGEGNRTGTMGDIIQRVAGQGGGAYLNKLLQDVSAGTAKGGVSGLAKLTANYKAASVGLNLRVALQQPTSYLRAAAVLDPKYLADPRVLKKGGWSKALKNAPIALWKDWGNFEINQGRQLQDIMFNTDSKLDRARNFSMKLAGAMDSLTWGRIWNACELEVAEKRPGLARGSAAFNEAVAQRFTDVIDQTQVVDNVLGRSQIMRSGDNLAKMATSYMGEPTQSYNLVYRAFRDWTQEQDNAKRTAAKKRLGRAVVALTASQFANAIAQALWDAVRDDDDRDEKYWERVLGHIMPNFAANANPVGMVPYLKDVVSVLQGYDVKRMDMAAITSFISACQNMSKAINGEGRYTLAGASANLMAEAGRIFGLPAATVKRDLVAIARSVGVETGDWYFQYQLEKALNSVGYSGNRGEFYDIAFGALQDGEMDVYQRITQDLMEQGVKAKTIESAMRDRLKAAQEEDESFTISLEARDLIASRDSYAPDTQEEDSGFTAESLDAASYQRYATQRAASYREMADTLEGYDTFAGLDDEVKDKVLDAAYTLADKTALAVNSGGRYKIDSKWISQADDMEAAGIEDWEYALFHVVYGEAESKKDDKGKTIKGEAKSDHVREWLEDNRGLTDKQRALLWGTVYNSEW